eukprot:5214666-Amphidinium_carterae.1
MHANGATVGTRPSIASRGPRGDVWSPPSIGCSALVKCPKLDLPQYSSILAIGLLAKIVRNALLQQISLIQFGSTLTFG